MDFMRKILTGMVILLVVILVGGGFYLTSMGGMNHGTPQTAHNAVDKQSADKSQPNKPENNNSGSSQNTPAQPGNELLGPVAPVIVQIQPPKTDPGVYVEQLREKLKSINEANSSIASNSGGHDAAAQQKGNSPTGNMNQLHQDFYKLGKDIAFMEQSLNQLSESMRDNKFATPQQFSYSYPNNYLNSNPQYPGYLSNQQSQVQQNQIQQNQQPANQTHQGNLSDNSGHSNMSMGQTNQSILPEGIFNVDSMRTAFTLLLLGSVILGIISVVGFLVSIFKPVSSPSQINNNSSL